MALFKKDSIKYYTSKEVHMYCNNCEAQLTEQALFCHICGRQQKTGGIILVPAKCTGCGSNLEVNASEQTAICPYCNSAYIVEQAINNYKVTMDGNINVDNATINVSGENTNNLLLRAKDFEERRDFKTALEYYNRILDIDFTKEEAHEGIRRVKDKIENFSYSRTQVSKGFSKGKLELKRNRLVYTTKKGKVEVYYLDKIKKIKTSLFSIEFEYPRKFGPVMFIFDFGLNKKWYEMIVNASRGVYPDISS